MPSPLVRTMVGVKVSLVGHRSSTMKRRRENTAEANTDLLELTKLLQLSYHARNVLSGSGQRRVGVYALTVSAYTKKSGSPGRDPNSLLRFLFRSATLIASL
jgi:hypothetical protein